VGLLYGNSGALLTKAGITRLSELIIDADKDWQGKIITNCGGAAAGMGKGDLLVHDGTVLVPVSPGSIGHEFTSNGHAFMPSWEPPPTP
jgi:hypothetical protein